MEFLEFLLWLSIALVFFSYGIYPLVMILYGKKEKRDYAIEHFPSVSIIIPAYNEEEFIENKIKNSLQLVKSYEGKIEILLGSDGSTDSTNQIIQAYEGTNECLRVFKFKERRGKISVLNDLVSKSNNNILVFTDASTIIDSGAIREIVKHFIDIDIGGVGGVKKINPSTSTSNVKEQEGLYWKIENLTKKGESFFGKVVGADGPLFAIRKELYNNFPSDTILDDFCISMYVAKKKKFIYEDRAIAYEVPSIDYKEEFKRRVRLSAGSYQVISYLKSVFQPFDRLAVFFISHKILRWYTPYFLIFTFISNLFLLTGIIYWITLMLQIMIYIMVMATHKITLLRKNKILSFVYFFISSNFVQLLGLIRFLKTRNLVLWDKTQK